MSNEQRAEFKKIFSSLSEERRSHVMSSFDKEESCILEYEAGKFLGCHLAAVETHYNIIAQSDNGWCYGLFKVRVLEVSNA